MNPHSRPLDETWRTVIARGNVSRDLTWAQQGRPFVPAYLSNGVLGGSHDEFGFHSRPNFDTDHGRTHLTHVEHYSRRHDNGGHVLRAFCHLQATDHAGNPPGLGLLRHWSQKLDLLASDLTTEWTTEHGSHLRTQVVADWQVLQHWVFLLDQAPSTASDLLTLRLEFDLRAAENHGPRSRPGHEKAMRELALSITAQAPLWRVSSQTDCRTTTTLWFINQGTVRPDDTGLTIRTRPGRTVIRALFLDPNLDQQIAQMPRAFLEAEPGTSLTAHARAVEKHWERCGLLSLPPSSPEAAWWPRLAWYARTSLSPEPSHIQVATGLNANIWGHGFPQDQWFAMMPLPRLGLHALTAAQLPYYRDQLPAWKRYTARLCHREGAFFAWEAPFTDIDQFELRGPTNQNAYQFHNAAYVVAMIWESFLVHRSRPFIECHAHLIEEVARFYVSNSALGPDGQALFQNQVVPLRSQDEATAEGAPTVQPICAVWSSLYTFRAYLECVRAGFLPSPDPSLPAKVAEILHAGFSFSPLLPEDGTLRTSATDSRPPGHQKHPPQLNPLTYLPMADFMRWPPVQESWKRRHDLCFHAREPYSAGWTFGQFALASARMGDPSALQSDLDLVQLSRLADPDWIQFYETGWRTGWAHKKSYYFTVMGLYTMALADCLAQDYHEGIDFFPTLLPRWEGQPLAFRNLHLRGGLITSGSLAHGQLALTFTATLDFESTVRLHLPGLFTLSLNGRSREISGNTPFLLRLRAGEEATLHHL